MVKISNQEILHPFMGVALFAVVMGAVLTLGAQKLGNGRACDDGDYVRYHRSYILCYQKNRYKGDVPCKKDQRGGYFRMSADTYRCVSAFNAQYPRRRNTFSVNS